MCETKQKKKEKKLRRPKYQKKAKRIVAWQKVQEFEYFFLVSETTEPRERENLSRKKEQRKKSLKESENFVRFSFEKENPKAKHKKKS